MSGCSGCGSTPTLYNTFLAAVGNMPQNQDHLMEYVLNVETLLVKIVNLW